jgi:phosphoribosylamine--glycine ligase
MDQRLRLLVVGSGGREHALAWKLAQSSRVAEVFVAPGNAGTATEPKCRNVPIAVDDIDGLVKFAIDEAIALTVVGPEVPLAAGLVDAMHGVEVPVFGPTRAAAQIEWSKAFCKEVLSSRPTAWPQVRAWWWR